MIFEIDRAGFSTIIGLLDDSMDNIEAKAVLKKTNPGWVFVDSLESPRTAMIYSKGIEGFYFVGDMDNPDFKNHINDYIDKEIKPRLLKDNINRFEFSGETEEWRTVLEAIFEARKLNISRQYIYRFKNNFWHGYEKNKLKDGYTLREIDKKLLNDASIENIEYISDELLKWWDSWDDYVKLTFGYCIVHENKVVNYCMCDYVYENIRPMGIETIEEHRRKGLSQVTTEAYIDRCIADGLEPYWECMESNMPSRTLAEKLKFTRNRVYTLYSFPII